MHFRNVILLLGSLTLLGCQEEEKPCTCSFEECMEQHGNEAYPSTPLELPKSTPQENVNENNISVSVTADNNYYVGDQLVSVDSLESSILNETLNTGTNVVELSGDEKSEWQANVRVIHIVKENDLKLVIKTDPN